MIGLEGALYPWRFRLVLALLALMVGAIVWRIVDLHVIDHDFLQAHGDARSVRHIPIPAHRGLITDRNGTDPDGRLDRGPSVGDPGLCQCRIQRVQQSGVAIERAATGSNGW